MSPETVSTAQTVFSIALFIVLTFFALTTAAFCYKRELLPIRARPFYTTLGIFVCSSLYAAELCVRWIWVEHQPCILTFVMLWPQSILVLNLFIIRAWLLWFHYKSTSEKSSLTLPLSTSYVSSEVLKCRWYLKNRHYASDAFLIKLYLSKTALELAIVWSTLVAYPSLATRIRSSDEIVCDVDGHTTWCYMLVIFYNAALCIYAALHFDEVADGFGLKLELKRMGCISMVGVSVWLLLFLLVEKDHDTFPYSSMWLLAGAVAVFVNSGVHPIWRSYEMRQTHIKSLKARLICNARDRSTADLVEWLSSPEARELFRRHLRLEFSVENLMFWEAVEEFRSEFKDDEPNRNAELARCLATRFLSESAPLQVNLQYTVVEPILRGLELTTDKQVANKAPCPRLFSSCFAQRVTGKTGDLPLPLACRPGQQPGDPNFAAPRSPSDLSPKLKVPFSQNQQSAVGEGEGLAGASGSASANDVCTTNGEIREANVTTPGATRNSDPPFSVSRTMFDKTQVQVLELMAADSWVRFKILQDELIKARIDARLQGGCRRFATSLRSVNAVEMVFVPESPMLHASADA